jgi:hypothetical protein
VLVEAVAGLSFGEPAMCYAFLQQRAQNREERGKEAYERSGVFIGAAFAIASSPPDSDCFVGAPGMPPFFRLLPQSSVRLDCCGGAFFPGGIAINLADVLERVK